MMRTLLALAFCLACSSLRAEWYTYSPPGSVDGQGILRDVLSRCDEAGRRTAFEPDHVTHCHEATHMLNSRIRAVMGGTGRVNVQYVGGGRCSILPEPRVTLETVSRYVRQYRNSTFQLYFVQQRRDWNNEPLYILDEWSAYTNGLQASQELRVDEHGELQRAQWFCHYADALLEAVKRHDPQYPKLQQLAEFIEWQKARVFKMADVVGTVVSKQVKDCWGGACYPNGGACGPSYYVQPSQPQPTQPIPSPPPAPTPQMKPCDCGPKLDALMKAVSANAGCKCDNTKIEQQLTAISASLKGQKGCQCDTSKLEAKIDALIAAVGKLPTTIPAPAPAPNPEASAEKHIVIVADHNDPYWQRLSEDIQKTKESFHGVQVAPSPAFDFGVKPQAVVYENSVPVRVVRGEQDVLDLLSRARRGMSF